MKKILGSLLILSISLFAKSTYEWTVDLKEKALFEHQSTVLSMQCKFSKEGKNDDVEFFPPSDIRFEFKLLSEKRHFEGVYQTLTYKYLLFAKKAGSYELLLKPTMLFTTQSAIDNVIEGRDNVNDLEVEKEVANIPAIKIEVEKTSSVLTGALSMKTDLDRQEASAYEPVHLELSIEGAGNLQDLDIVDFNIKGVQVFADKAEEGFVLSEDGYKGKWLQRFAFVGKEDFIIPSVEFHYFDLKDKKQKTLKTQTFSIKIKADGIQREDLIDAVDLPSSKIDFFSYLEYLYYALTFMAGFIVAKLVKLPRKSIKKEKGEKIKKAKNNKELLEVLMICEKNLFVSEIEDLEKAVYKSEKIELSVLKKRALSKL